MSIKIKKSIAKLVVVTVVSMPISLWANTEQNLPQMVPPSNWALDALIDGEAYGILTKDYTTGLRLPITTSSFESILKGMELKIEALGLSTGEGEIYKELPKELTREVVLMTLYDVLSRYDLPHEMKIKEESPMEWMQSRKYVQGDGKGLNLEKLCTLEEMLTFTTRIIEDCYEVSNQGAKGLIWEATNGNNTVYLLGTVHMGQSSLYPIHKSLMKAFAQSDAIAFEVDFNNQEDLVYLMEQQMFTDGTTLKDYVSSEVYAQTVEKIVPLGLTEEQINRYKPMTLANLMTVSAAQEEQTGELPLPVLDVYFQSKTYVNQKELIELEGIRYQTDFLYNAPMDTQVFMLEDALKGIEYEQETDTSTLNEWLVLWANGDEVSFEKSFHKNEQTGIEMIDKFNEELFDKRDQNMTKKVVEMLNNTTGKTYMVIVGAGHMTGETGIVKSLQDLGYTVKVYEETK